MSGWIVWLGTAVELVTISAFGHSLLQEWRERRAARSVLRGAPAETGPFRGSEVQP